MTEVVVEKKALLERLDNDTQFLGEVVGMFLADCPAMLAAIQAAVSAGDSKQIMNASHALKGTVSIFGAKKAVEAAQSLESMGRRGTLDNTSEALSVLEREISLVTCALQEIATGTV
jgi:two-component system, sensor histidine kinase and response regulator